MNLAIVGGTTLDLIFPEAPRLPAWPRHTEFTPENLVLLSDPPIFTLGGNGANAALVAARCGADVVLHTRLGEDWPGIFARQRLEEAGCRVAVPAGRARTGVNVTVANRRQQRATFFYPGLTPSLPARRLLPEAGHVLVCGWPHPPMDELAAVLPRWRKSGLFVALDAGPILGDAWSPEALYRVLRGTDLFLANEHELKTLTRTATIKQALKQVRQGFDGHLVLKRGGRGAVWLPAGSAGAVRVAAHPVRAIHTVGAGDSFNGALLAALSRGFAFPKALHAACATAASVVASARGVLGARPAGGLQRRSASVSAKISQSPSKNQSPER